VYVDLVCDKEVCFELTGGTIETLTRHYDRVLRAILGRDNFDGSDMEIHLATLKPVFLEAIRKYVLLTGKDCFERMQSDGSGNLHADKSAEVESTVLAFFHLLLLASDVSLQGPTLGRQVLKVRLGLFLRNKQVSHTLFCCRWSNPLILNSHQASSTRSSPNVKRFDHASEQATCGE
jgi:hypothetical protein